MWESEWLRQDQQALFDEGCFRDGTPVSQPHRFLQRTPIIAASSELGGAPPAGTSVSAPQLVSGWPPATAASLALDAGVDECLAKPLTYETLLGAFARHDVWGLGAGRLRADPRRCGRAPTRKLSTPLSPGRAKAQRRSSLSGAPGSDHSGAAEALELSGPMPGLAVATSSAALALSYTLAGEDSELMWAQADGASSVTASEQQL
jgi:hypothetical protein